MCWRALLFCMCGGERAEYVSVCVCSWSWLALCERIFSVWLMGFRSVSFSINIRFRFVCLFFSLLFLVRLHRKTIVVLPDNIDGGISRAAFSYRSHLLFQNSIYLLLLSWAAKVSVCAFYETPHTYTSHFENGYHAIHIDSHQNLCYFFLFVFIGRANKTDFQHAFNFVAYVSVKIFVQHIHTHKTEENWLTFRLLCNAKSLVTI